MNPTAAVAPRSSTVATQADGSVVVALATDPRRPPVGFDALVRHPAPFRAALAAFLQAVTVAPHPQVRHAAPADQTSYVQARQQCARDLITQHPQVQELAHLVAPLVTVASDAWIIEGFAADQSAYARLSAGLDDFGPAENISFGTASVLCSDPFARSLRGISTTAPIRVRLGVAVAAEVELARAIPSGWLRGFGGIQAALSLPTRRIPIDRGGLFGLITALGSSRRTRATRSIVVNWSPGEAPVALIQPAGRPVSLHAQARGEGPGGSVSIPVGHGLLALAGLLPWVDSAELLVLGSGLPSCWCLRLGSIRFVLCLPSWTPDGRWGSLSLDPVLPPFAIGQVLANQVAATFREHPVQTWAEVVERSRTSEPKVAAILGQLASLGQLLPEPEAEPGRWRWRSVLGEPVASGTDPEPAEVTAARAIVATSSIQLTRDEVEPTGQGRQVEGLILDRPVTIRLDLAGWLRRGHCTCSHHLAGSFGEAGPCRHLLALQAHVQARPGSPPKPPDLATWLARFPSP